MTYQPDFDHEEDIVLSELVTPDMANHHGTLFGGDLLALIDKAAYVAAARHCRKSCVTASIDQVNFLEPVPIGELVVLHARVVFTGKSSMTVEVLTTAEDLEDGTVRTVNTSYATLVALEDGHPAAVPQIKCTSPEHRRSCLRAAMRRRVALEHRSTIRGISKLIETLSDEEVAQRLNNEHFTPS